MKTSLEITVPARLESLPVLVKSVTDFAREQGYDRKLLAIELILEETFVNICTHSYPERAGEVKVTCADRGGRFIIEITDSGVPFDITAAPDPDITKDLTERTVGGLGILLTRKFADDVSYEQKGGRNIVRFTVGLSGDDRDA